MNSIPPGWIPDGKGGYSKPPRVGLAGAVTSGVAKESELHADILAECKKRGWIAFHGSMAHSTYRTEGEPDFVILANNGRLIMIECKTRTGKLSPEQLGIQQWAAKLGHTIHVVRSMEEFLTI